MLNGSNLRFGQYEITVDVVGQDNIVAHLLLLLTVGQRACGHKQNPECGHKRPPVDDTWPGPPEPTPLI